MELRDYLKEHIMITDGAFGTFYAQKYQSTVIPELDNIDCPERVAAIHAEYIKAGAQLLRTNTYACNTNSLGKPMDYVVENIRAAVSIAKNAIVENEGVNCEAACDGGFPIFLAGDIGPIRYDHSIDAEFVQKEYVSIAMELVSQGVDAICFETFSELTDILPAILEIKNNSDVFVIVQFAVNQFGYSDAGISAKNLIAKANAIPQIDAMGFNCGIGPGHMYQILSRLTFETEKILTALPNAGYPQNVSNRMIFASDNVSYFAEKQKDIASLGISVFGGCCGTTPEYIEALCNRLKGVEKIAPKSKEKALDVAPIERGTSLFQKHDQKIIAVELAPPIDSNDEKLMEAAHLLEKLNVDIVNFPDSPSGRTRADSILMAEKVAKETNLTVMPHLCCRDKNAIAMRSQLLGAHLNHIRDFLIITGDPIPSMMRQSVKSVFQFDSVGLMNIIQDMNTEQFEHHPLVYGGAINQNRRNLDVEIMRVHKKMDAGASFFMTQPVFDLDGVEKLRRIKNETNATILCGIMPFVSLKNALFMKNEMTGIDVSKEIIARYEKCQTKEDGEAVGVAIAKEVIAMTQDFVDGYYFSFPFNRVYLLEKIFL